MSDLLAAIGRALGEPYAEIQGDRAPEIHLGTGTSPPVAPTREVIGGAADEQGRAAWFELRSDTPGKRSAQRAERAETGARASPERDPSASGYVPVEIDLRVAWGGELRAVSTLETYNPYFGCHVRFAKWYGDRFAYIYREKHRMIAGYLAPPYQSQRLVSLADQLVMDGDAVYFLDLRGALRGRIFPTLAPVVPVPIPVIDDYRVQDLDIPAPGIATLATWVEDAEIEAEIEGWEARLEARRQRADRVRVPLAPIDLALPRDLRHRWRALLRERGVDPERIGSIIQTAGVPWVEPESAPTTGYAGLERPAFRATVLEERDRIALAPFSASRPVWGWSGDFDRLFESRIAALLGGYRR